MKFKDLVKKLEEDFISPFNGTYQQINAQGGQSGGTTSGDHSITFPNRETGMTAVTNAMFPKIEKLRKKKKKIKKRAS